MVTTFAKTSNLKIMKKLSIILSAIFLLSIFTSNAQDSIPNADFETWTTGTSPQSWQTVNSLLPPGFFACYQTANSYSADYALQLKTIDVDGLVVPGVVTLGEVGMGYTAGGIGFTAKPQSLKGFIRHPSAGDEVMVVAQFFKNGNEIGSAFWSTTDSVGDFTEFVAPVYFQTNENPDTLNITILSDPTTIGSSLVIDMLAFEFPTVAVHEPSEQKIAIYPNPCSTKLFMDLPGNMPVEVRIFDMQGKQVFHTKQQERTIGTASLPRGMYTVLVQSKDEMFREKLIKE